MNRKSLPSLFMLTAGAVISIVSYLMDYTVLEKLVSLFVVMVVFGALGGALQWTLNYFDAQNEEVRKDEQAEAEAEAAETNAAENVQI